jgi:hypothetical protein
MIDVEKCIKIRNLIAFWYAFYEFNVFCQIFTNCYSLFGLCNNVAYVIMLTSAEDIMNRQNGKNNTKSHYDVDHYCEVIDELIFIQINR